VTKKSPATLKIKTLVSTAGGNREKRTREGQSSSLFSRQRNVEEGLGEVVSAGKKRQDIFYVSLYLKKRREGQQTCGKISQFRRKNPKKETSKKNDGKKKKEYRRRRGGTQKTKQLHM